MSFQQLTLIGNVGQDPEMKYVSNGRAVTTFNVAYSYKKQDAEVTTWFRCSAWDKTAEVVNNYVQKGDEVMVMGRVALNQYTKNDGTPGASLEVQVDRVNLLRNGRTGQQVQVSAGHAPIPQFPQSVVDAGSLPVIDAQSVDDLPF